MKRMLRLVVFFAWAVYLGAALAAAGITVRDAAFWWIEIPTIFLVAFSRLVEPKGVWR